MRASRAALEVASALSSLRRESTGQRAGDFGTDRCGDTFRRASGASQLIVGGATTRFSVC